METGVRSVYCTEVGAQLPAVGGRLHATSCASAAALNVTGPSEPARPGQHFVP